MKAFKKILYPDRLLNDSFLADEKSEITDTVNHRQSQNSVQYRKRIGYP
jgi:hypothetical protein